MPTTDSSDLGTKRDAPKRDATSPLPEDDVDENGRKTRSRIKRINLDDDTADYDSSNAGSDLLAEKQGEGETSVENLPTPENVDLGNHQGKAKISLDDKVDLLSDKVDKILGYLAANKGELSAINKRNERKFKFLEDAHNDVADKIDLINADITTNAVQVARNATNIEASESAIASLETQLRICKATNEEYIGKFKDMTSEMKNLRCELTENKRAVLDLGLEVRDRRLVLTGIPELEGEEPITSAITACNKMLSHALKSLKGGAKSDKVRPKFRTLKIDDIDDAYRIGKLQTKKKWARGLVVTFSFTHIRKMVLATKNHIKDMGEKCFVNEDLTQDARDHRANLKVIAEAGQALGHETKITGNKLVIDSESFQPDEIGAVSPTILQASKREKHLEDGIAFRGDRSIFSNFFPALMVVDDTEYCCVEQYFQHAKAVQCGNDNQARKIMNKTNPLYMKLAGKKVEITEGWKKDRLRILHQGIFAKFDQNAPLKQALLSTVGLNLYEATTDLFYACGINLDSPKWATKDWPGQNVTGEILMKVRKELLDEDTLGNSSGDNTLMNLSSSVDEDGETHGKTVDAASMKDQASEMEIEVASQDWPELEKTLSFTEVVKSSNSVKNVNNQPKLNQGSPQFTPNRGRGKSSRYHTLRTNPPFPSDKMTDDDMAFLEITGKKKNYSHHNNPARGQANRGGTNRGRNRHRYSSASSTSTPYKAGINENSLSPGQLAAMKYLGFPPDSGFVRNAISSHSKRK